LLTSEVSALLQVVDALSVVALAQLFPHQPRHHALHPLLSDHGILRGFERFVVIVVDAVEGWGDCGLGCLEHGGLRSRHGCGWALSGRAEGGVGGYGSARVPMGRFMCCLGAWVLVVRCMRCVDVLLALAWELSSHAGPREGEVRSRSRSHWIAGQRQDIELPSL
jgi:hypothetical protein